MEHVYHDARTDDGSRNATGTMTGGSTVPSNICILPRCEIRFEKCAGGFKILLLLRR